MYVTHIGTYVQQNLCGGQRTIFWESNFSSHSDIRALTSHHQSCTTNTLYTEPSLWPWKFFSLYLIFIQVPPEVCSPEAWFSHNMELFQPLWFPLSSSIMVSKAQTYTAPLESNEATRDRDAILSLMCDFKDRRLSWSYSGESLCEASCHHVCEWPVKSFSDLNCHLFVRLRGASPK